MLNFVIMTGSLLKYGMILLNNIKKTNEEFINELHNKLPQIHPLEEYKGANTKIQFKCLIHNYIWSCAPHNLLRGFGCPKCAKRYKRTENDFISELLYINPDIEIMSPFINMHTKIRCKCKIDKYEWETTPSVLFDGHRCPKCTGANKKTNQEFIDELKNINPNIQTLEEYQGAHIKILCKCLKDDYTWYAEPNTLLKGVGCPKCDESKGEMKIRLFLENKNCYFSKEYSFKNCKYKNPLPFDFAIFKDEDKTKLKCLIEFDGEQHYRPVMAWGGNDLFKSIKRNDSIKTKYCKTNYIKLIRIPYYEFQNINNILNDTIEVD